MQRWLLYKSQNISVLKHASFLSRFHPRPQRQHSSNYHLVSCVNNLELHPKPAFFSQPVPGIVIFFTFSLRLVHLMNLVVVWDTSENNPIDACCAPNDANDDDDCEEWQIVATLTKTASRNFHHTITKRLCDQRLVQS